MNWHALICTVLFACGSSSSTSPDAGDGAPPPTGPFSLMLKIDGKLLTNAPWSTSWYVVVRDRSDGEIVFWERLRDDQGSATFVRTIPGKLVAGHSYDVGIAGGYYLPCEAGKDIWFDEIVGVSKDVAITRTIVRERDTDLRGCDVIHEPIGLPAGSYRNAGPILNDGANGIELIVSSTGRLYRKRVFVLCPSTTSCSSSLISEGPTCDSEITPVPEQTVLSVGNSGSATRLSGTATINRAAGQFDYAGKVTTWTSSTLSTQCCEQSFTTALVRTGPPSVTCR